MRRPQIPRVTQAESTQPKPVLPEVEKTDKEVFSKPSAPGEFVKPVTTKQTDRGIRTRLRGYFSAGGAVSAFASKQGKVIDLVERRRELRLAKLRTFGRFGLIALAAISLLSIGLWAVLFSSFFALDSQQVRIVKGSEKVTQTEIDKLVEPWVGVSLARISTSEIAQKVTAIPLVKTASVKRDWPNGLSVEMDLRVPAFSEQVEGKWHVYDTEGVEIFEARELAPGTVAVELKTSEVREKALQLMANVRSQFDAELLGEVVAMRSDGNLVELVLKSTAVVKWGDASEPEFKLKVLKILLGKVGAKMYDVSVPEKPVTR